MSATYVSHDDALTMLKDRGHEGSQLHHALETEAVMRALAERLGQDADLWGVTGLLHDVDYTSTKNTPEEHGIVALEILKDSLPEEALNAIQRHNEMNGSTPSETFDYALRCAETVTGLVSANALVRPDGMKGMTPKSLKKKMKDKAFAANVNRDIIRECEKVGVDLTEFLQLAVDAITPLADECGLSK